MGIEEIRQRKDFNRAMVDWFRAHGLRRMIFGVEFEELTRAVYGIMNWRLRLSMLLFRIGGSVLRVRMRVILKEIE